MIVVLTSSLNSHGSKELAKAASKLGVDVKVRLINGQDTADVVEQATVVIPRIGPKSYSDYEVLAKKIKDIKKRNQISDTLAAFDKCKSYQIMQDTGIATPVSQIITQDGVPPFLPGVFKIARGNQGLGVELIKDAKSYHEFVNNNLSGGALLYQQYIAESKGDDKRIIVCGDRVLASMRRTAAGDDFRANLHLGGTATAYDPTPNEVALSIAATKAHRLPFAGVDIIDSDTGPQVLEVNPSPGFVISQITGIDLAVELLKQMMNGENK